ncbi:MAG: sensor histidine kinase [Oscillospiraceae bacterium]
MTNKTIQKNILFTDIFHEIENPLSSIIKSAEELINSGVNDEQKKYAENIIHSGDAIYSIIKNLNSLHMNSGSITESINETYKFQTLISDVYNLTLSQLKNKSLKFVLKLNPTLPETLIGDSFRLKHILMNIIEISMKSTSEGSITLSADWNGNADSAVFIFNIKDTGKKSADENLSDTAFSNPAVNCHMAELLGGNITINKYDEGNSFTLTISQKVGTYSPIGEDAAEIIMENRYNLPENKFVSAESSENIININKGIIYFSGNMDEYLDILSAIYSDSLEHKTALSNVSSITHMDKYINRLISFKSIAKLIGADKFTRIIKANEYSYNHQDYDFINNNLNIVISVYNETMSEINKLLIENGRNTNVPEPDIPENQYTDTGVSLMKAAYFIDNFNAESARNELEKLIDSDETDWIKKEVIKRAVKMLSDCCYQEVKNLAVAMAEGEKI